MDIDDDEDFYDPEPSSTTVNKPAKADGASTTSPTVAAAAATESKPDPKAELEEGEEEDEGGAMDEDSDSDSDSDIDIITERKDGTKAAPPTQSRYSDIRNIPQRSTSNEVSVKPPPPAASKSPTATKPETPSKPLAVPSADKIAAAASNSKIDVEGNPVYGPAGKRITAVNIDEDLAENEKPWRKPGTDISDYFNYGFDEFTWALYAAKQESLRGEFNTDSIMGDNKKMMENFGMMMMGAQGGPGQVGMPSMDGMPPEMQAMMQSMMGGMDPSQMDPSAMQGMFAGMQGQGVGQGGQGQNFGQGGFGNQGQFGGYDQQGMGGGGRGGFGGRGRGGRNRW